MIHLETDSASAIKPRNRKAPFDIDIVMSSIETAVKPFAKAALFELAELGYTSVFEQLIACVISIRTLDEVTLPTSLELFKHARTPDELLNLTVAEIDRIIRPSTFHRQKAYRVRALAQIAADQFEGKLPADPAVLRDLPGIGPKCAHLVVAISAGEPWISVDTHVHRVTNRWGYVEGRNPDATRLQLETRLPKRYWIDINRLLVPFGKHICTGRLPKCSTCPVERMCRQVGVRQFR